MSARNDLLRSPFMLAAANNSFNLMELLLQRASAACDADELTLVDAYGNTSLHLALIHGHENCALFILDRVAAASMHLVNMQNEDGNTPLHLAAAKGYLTCVEILLSKGKLLKHSRYS